MKQYSTEEVVNYGMLVADTFNTYSQNKNNLTPLVEPNSLIGENLVIDGYLIANDCVASGLVKPSCDQCFYGFLAHEKNNPQHYIALVRGTGNQLEWIDDAKALPNSYHVANTGEVESGFYDIYQSMQYLPIKAPTHANLKNAADGISDEVLSHGGSLTITGHSLGSAIATYLMYDVASIEKMKPITDMCLFASPKPGNAQFAKSFEAVTSNYAVYNYSLDLVPQVPPSALGYQSLQNVISITPDNAQAVIKNNILSNHHVVCYSAMLDYQYSNNWATLLSENGDSPDCIVGSHTPTTSLSGVVKESVIGGLVDKIKTIRNTITEQASELVHEIEQHKSTFKM
jgi:triacylglycerol lipase